MEKKYAKRMRIGYVVFGSLVGMKFLEYLVITFIKKNGWPYMAVIAFAGAWVIYYYFMHVHQLWRRDQNGE